ncbi:aldehyde dehydrogenase family protein [Haloferax sp. Atlit-4N]|uniref:2,5-dioxovalerate dehydrogenase n=1 Tax=Haloferax sp. Atlit-4N TaxID=2077206 RepID=UPI000E27A3A0|nr:aldehyde dehydrogenase family protein [Haloferax sp. Atlit-4N]RDZ51039.1 aldehyde dehydrogenase family protein [Haloferax sp. Atlit-4N]
MSRTYGNFIDGEWTDTQSGETFEVTNPAAAGEVVSVHPASSETDVEAALDAAVAAQDEWASTPGPSRGAILREAGNNLEARKEEATEVLVREEGKTRSEAGGEVQRAIDIFHYYGAKARDFGGTVKSASAPGKDLYTKHEPLGTVALITPWNYPIAIPVWKLAPALAAGNTVVLKPASEAPGVVSIVLECLDDAGLPAGVANTITGSGSEVGGPLIESERIDGVSFTGSTAVGTMVAETAAVDLKRVQCEMGGKNPTVVMPSADIEAAAETVGVGAFGTTGQSCTATSRAIVHEDVYDEFVAAVSDYAESLVVGDGLDDPDMGPHVSENELSSTLEYIDIGSSEGATLEAGGSRLSGDDYDDGYFVEPTVFSGVENDARIAQEEIFGPVLAVVKADSFEDALDLANDVDYGLSASIVTQDLSEGKRFVNEVEAGVAKINEKTTGLELHVPFGGYKDSSTNTYREQGDAGLDFFSSVKTIYENY